MPDGKVGPAQVAIDNGLAMNNATTTKQTVDASTGLLVVALYVGLVVANFAWLWPILNGDPISNAHWQSELWLPSWR